MKVDVSAYLVLGRENTNGRSVARIVEEAVRAGFTCIQIRSKTASALEMIEDCRESAKAIAKLGKADSVALLVDDRLDIVLAAREMGIKVDGIHVGQSDIPVSICRKFLGDEAIVGLSAPTKDLISFVEHTDVTGIDYFGAAPVHATPTKPECGLDENGNVVPKTLGELSELAKKSPIPVVAGGGVKLADVVPLRKAGLGGFFVVSAVAAAENPYEEAKKLVDAWK